MPQKKYCDITGYETTYKDPASGLYFKDYVVQQYIKHLSKSVKDQYVSIRNPGGYQRY